MEKFLILVTTLLGLGISNVLVVSLYRFAKRYGLLAKRMPQGPARRYQLFSVPVSSDSKNRLEKTPDSQVLNEASNLLAGLLRYFSHRQFHVGSPPDWFLNPITKKNYPDYQQHWSKQHDFDPEIGDIKCIWEASRFDWTLILVRAYGLLENDHFLHALNDWCSDWTLRNPLNTGPNWKCGQEAGIRMIQVLLSAFLLEQHTRPTPDLIQFVTEHCTRIEPTIRYAVAQDNNHGTSEAAALFIGGAWLCSMKTDSGNLVKARRWRKMGRGWLENRISHLIEDDGSFSQYSVNYHRVMLDTLCQVEFWRELLGEEPFSDMFYQKAKAATRWLFMFTNERTGDAPNIGANDGARLFNLSSAGFRDFRPTVQLASRLFYGGPAYPPGKHDEPLHWLGLENSAPDPPSQPLTKRSTLFEQGGYCYLVKGDLEIFIRFPRFSFRPGQADALHIDLWFRGLNIVRDAGTYSYNTEEPWQSYFPGTRSHSTVEFDERDQMPRVGRFLFGRWLKTRQLSPIRNIDEKLVWSAGYKDYQSAEHSREVILEEGKVTVKDIVKKFNRRAVIRWRLAPGRWSLENGICSSEIGMLKVFATAPIRRHELTEGYESRHYLEKTSLPVFEIEVHQDAEVTTEFTLT